MNKYLLGIDMGGTMLKAVLFDERGYERTVCCRHVRIIQSKAGWNERDATLMWQETCEMISELLNSSGIKADEILAISCTGHGNGLYLVDSKGIPVRNAINSTDNRASEYIKKWKEKGIDKAALPFTAQSLWAAQPNALLAWLIDHEPEVVSRASWLLMAKDFIRMKLTGEFYAEITDMSGTSLMNVTTGTYDDHILELFGIQKIKSLLPPLIGSSDLAGKVTGEAALLTGLKDGTPVAGGMFDIDACALASGIIDDNQMSLVAGTWGNNQYIAPKPLIDPDLFMSSIYSIPGWYLMLEGSPTSANNLDWFILNFLAKEKDELGEHFFQWLNSEVDSISPESSNILFLPFLFGCNEKAEIKACFYGMDGSNTRTEMIRAVYEGIIFSHRNHIDRLLKFRKKPDVIRCTGGAAQSEVWMQMFADVMGIPMEIPEGTQLGALGSAMAAGVCCGLYTNFQEAVRVMSRIRQRFEPDDKRSIIYNRKYRQYKIFVRQLKLMEVNRIKFGEVKNTN